MKKLFQCDICTNVHTTEKLAFQCEQSHLKPDRQELMYDRTDKTPKYPKAVKLWFGNTCCKYERS